MKPGSTTAKSKVSGLAKVRAITPHLTNDRYWADEMAALQDAVLAGEIGAPGLLD